MRRGVWVIGYRNALLQYVANIVAHKSSMAARKDEYFQRILTIQTTNIMKRIYTISVNDKIYDAIEIKGNNLQEIASKVSSSLTLDKEQ